MTRISTAVLAAMVLALPATAQDDLQAKYEQKLAKDFVKKAAWVQTIADAQAQAKASNKMIFGYFTRSYSP